MNTLRVACGLVGISLICCLEAVSMERHAASLEQVVEQSRLAVVASATELSSRRQGEAWKVLEFHARVLSVLYGESSLTSMGCTFEEGQAHHRGRSAVSPRVTGSGIEFDIQSGDRVVLLIERSPTGSRDCRVLRIEPLSSADRVRALRR